MERKVLGVFTCVRCEKKTALLLKNKIKMLGLEEYIFDVMVPISRIVKSNGKVKEELLAPGYVFVEMFDMPEVREVINSISYVMGILGEVKEEEYTFLKAA